MSGQLNAPADLLQGKNPGTGSLAEWAPQVIWTFSKTRKICCFYAFTGNRILDLPPRGVVSIPTSLAWMYLIFLLVVYLVTLSVSRWKCWRHISDAVLKFSCGHSGNHENCQRNRLWAGIQNPNLPMKSTECQPLDRILHDHPLWLCCPDVLSLEGDPLTGRRMWFTESHLVLVIVFSLMFYLFIFYSWYNKWSAISSKTTRSFLGNWHSHFSVRPLTPHSYATEFALDC